MSDYEQVFYPSSGPPRVKQRRRERSCDICRKRKTRCDGPDMPNGTCSNCLAFGAACTYVLPSKKRGPKNATVEELTKENETLKAKLRSSVCSLCAQPLHSRGDTFQHSSPGSDNATTEEQPTEDPYIGDELASRFRQFSITNFTNKHYGSAGSYALAHDAMAMKEKYMGRPMVSHARRRLYWDVLPWEKDALTKSRARYVYPDGDLITSLLELYFAIVHPTLPVLHRPSFERSVAEGLHLTNMEFGGLLLSVLAVASRYSHDPRVFVKGDRSLSSGWKFANQIEIVRRFFEPTLYEVQMYCLMLMFSLGVSTPQISWLYLGLSIRFLQQRGDHRRKRDLSSLSIEDELWKRCFWVIFSLDAMMSVFLGRPMGLHGEDYDIDLPLQVDDEYWDAGFNQPTGKPPLISYFISHARLCEILGDAMRRLHGSRKSKLLMGWNGPEWEDRTISQLDSAMNEFLDTIPPHLRWDPESPPQGVFFDQSASLHISYQYILITIHRPYLEKPDASGALAICTKAARAIIHTADIWLNKLQRLPPPNMFNPVFVSGLLLGLNMFATKRAGLMDMNRDLAYVERAMDILKFRENRWQPLGRLWELLGELLSLDGPMSQKTSDGAAESTKDEHQPVPETSSTASGSSLYYQQQEPTPPEPVWAGSFSSDHSSEPRPAMTIEQIEQQLASTIPLDPMHVVLDDELLSMWMAAPTDVSNIGSWDAYYANINGTNSESHG
ncbi:fungal-specific transcription factor domain-containing protein [Mycena alexandri]|uniref:Fungal-specific transcription factor domain-containing protein n=1 Tax=Mycena alexandri TaxID=1745969 RepID=A0AAD6TEN1_9AGAR|nr:fungal-specific transcription factor domain-containing protein [Mycena alexandri]